MLVRTIALPLGRDEEETGCKGHAGPPILYLLNIDVE
jgi:hypothetical protein